MAASRDRPVSPRRTQPTSRSVSPRHGVMPTFSLPRAPAGRLVAVSNGCSPRALVCRRNISTTTWAALPPRSARPGPSLSRASWGKERSGSRMLRRLVPVTVAASCAWASTIRLGASRHYPNIDRSGDPRGGFIERQPPEVMSPLSSLLLNSRLI
jgi:hypothetical protein